MTDSSSPVADQIRAHREGFARVAKELGFDAIAATIRSGGPVEPNMRIVMRSVRAQARILDPKTRTRVVNARTRRIEKKAMALEAGLEAALKRFESLGGR